MSAAFDAGVALLVCTTCRRVRPRDAAGPRPGAQLLDALRALGLPANVHLKAVECLSNCASGCTIVLRGPGRWTYVYGNPETALHAGVIAEGAAKYRDRPDGIVPWRERPEHFRRNCLARIPPLESFE